METAPADVRSEMVASVAELVPNRIDPSGRPAGSIAPLVPASGVRAPLVALTRTSPPPGERSAATTVVEVEAPGVSTQSGVASPAEPGMSRGVCFVQTGIV